MGIPHSWVGKVEIGERRLDLAEYVQFCRAIEVEPARGIAIVEAALGPYAELARSIPKAAETSNRYSIRRRKCTVRRSWTLQTKGRSCRGRNENGDVPCNYRGIASLHRIAQRFVGHPRFARHSLCSREGVSAICRSPMARVLPCFSQPSHPPLTSMCEIRREILVRLIRHTAAGLRPKPLRRARTGPEDRRSSR